MFDPPSAGFSPKPIAHRDRRAQRRQVDMSITHRTHRIATGIVATLALALAAAAPASATPWDPNSRDPFIPIRPAPEPAMVAPAPTHLGRGSVVVRLTTDRGFDWGAAGVGAGAGAATVLVSVGGVRAGSRARVRRTLASRR
jgi:hypothetical protein